MKSIIPKRKLWFTISSTLIVLSVLSMIAWGLRPAIDFTGGSLLEVKFHQNVPTSDEIKNKVAELELDGDIVVQPTGEDGMIIRMKPDDEETHQKVVEKLKESFNTEQEQNLEEMRFESIGPAIGAELKKKAIVSVVLVLIAIVLYIAWAFRKVSWPIASWKYGVIAIIALFHDIIITIGVFAVLGRFMNLEVGLPFVAALLTILGYSVNDTIVVFDRVRENLAKHGKGNFEDLVNRSVNQTLVRSMNTSITTLLILFVIFLFGGASIKFFVLALLIGVILGTYSSIFIASPLLVVWKRISKKMRE